jgi:hypothetical protein
MQVRERFDDRLEPLGIAVGAFLVLIALGTLLGQPWTSKSSVVAIILQLLGVVGTGAIGAGLIYLSWTGNE